MQLGEVRRLVAGRDIPAIPTSPGVEHVSVQLRVCPVRLDGRAGRWFVSRGRAPGRGRETRFSIGTLSPATAPFQTSWVCGGRFLRHVAPRGDGLVPGIEIVGGAVAKRVGCSLCLLDGGSC